MIQYFKDNQKIFSKNIIHGSLIEKQNNIFKKN